MRNTAIDFEKGLLSVIMIYGHVLQFFGNSEAYPIIPFFILGINLIVFPSFLFCFGYAIKLAYLRKSYIEALPRIIRTCWRTLVCFWISGIAYRLLCSHSPLDRTTVVKVLLLYDLPGWSEFLASFAMYSFLLLFMFPVLKKIEKRPWMLLLSLSCILLCKIPYEEITSPHLGLLIGGTEYAYFPVIQYMPFYIAGIVYNKSDRSSNIFMIIVAILSSVLSVGWIIGNDFVVPDRFPPHWAWIMLPAAGVMAFTIISDLVCNLFVLANKRLRQFCVFFRMLGDSPCFIFWGVMLSCLHYQELLLF